MLICGIDEAGRGPLAGPVVVAAVVFEEGNSIELVRDSKKLKAFLREELYDKIIEECEDYKIEIVGNDVIDEMNILKATMLGMERCLTSFKNRDAKIFIDGNYFKLNDSRQKDYDYETVVKGDDKIFEISCASILAKVTRDKLMREHDKKYPLYNFKQHKGYATKEHISNIKKYGLCNLHRKTFCRRILEYTYPIEYKSI
ncbi:MAG: ribonuclease HII [Ignavibacteria bacterium]|nr:ribonuclease HII [Bacteroidota bacterium]MBL7127816.1 ribonuclease HII [Ignavibacteria bacterium]